MLVHGYLIQNQMIPAQTNLGRTPDGTGVLDILVNMWVLAPALNSEL